MSVDSPRGSRAVVLVARNLARMPAGRLNCLNVRLADEEMREVSAAARPAGLTPTGYAGEVAVAAARADAGGSAAGAARAELARVQGEGPVRSCRGQGTIIGLAAAEADLLL